MGHDNQILVEPDRAGVILPVADGFGAMSLELYTRFTDVGPVDRITVTAEGAGLTYGSESLGSDADFRLAATFRRRLGDRFAADLEFLGGRFRRDQVEQFNLNQGQTLVRLAYAPGTAWLTTVGVRYGVAAFPDRPVAPESDLTTGPGDVEVTPLTPVTEQDEQFDVLLGGLRRFSGGAFLSAELLHRATSSNQARAAYTGPSLTLRAGKALPAGLEGALYFSYTHRAFTSPYPVALAPGGGYLTEARRDDSRQVGLSVAWAVDRRVGVFGDVGVVNQNSSLPDYEFDQVRVMLGLTVDLWTAGGMRRPIELTPLAPAAETPLVTQNGVRFRYSSPTAQSVLLVGDFNGWQRGVHALEPRGDGAFEITVPLDRGIWRYAFVVDGEWVRPPAAPRYEPDGFGGLNGVVEVLDVSPGVAVTRGPEDRPNEETADSPRTGDREPDSR